MSREKLLSEWKRYPQAPEGCQSLTRWKREAGWVGGRAAFTADGQFFIHSEPAQSLKIQAAGLLEGIQAGDHVAFLLTQPSADGSWQASRVKLLAPAEQMGMCEFQPKWRPFLNQVRQFFIHRGFTEIETPSLVVCPGFEPALEPFSSELKCGSNSRELFLPTSPEIHLKKALCFGLTDIFEIKSCYRNGEISEHHQPEFHMLEWYRAYSDLELVIDDLCELVQTVGGEKPTVTTFRALLKEHAGVDLTPQTERTDLWNWCIEQNLQPDSNDTWNDLFHRLWIDRIETKLTKPTIVRDFPPSMAALARRKEDGWADRFEFYWNGLEIANAFHEVNDPGEQLERWQGEQAERRRLGTRALPMDDELLEKMKRHGLPPTGGIALGVERLFMAAENIKDIRSLKLFRY